MSCPKSPSRQCRNSKLQPRIQTSCISNQRRIIPIHKSRVRRRWVCRRRGASPWLLACHGPLWGDWRCLVASTPPTTSTYPTSEDDQDKTPKTSRQPDDQTPISVHPRRNIIIIISIRRRATRASTTIANPSVARRAIQKIPIQLGAELRIGALRASQSARVIITRIGVVPTCSLDDDLLTLEVSTRTLTLSTELASSITTRTTIRLISISRT